MNTSPLPHWPPGTVAILATGGETPHAIPVSALLRAAPDRVLLGLASGRESLRRLRRDPGVTLALVSRGVAISIDGSARVLDEDLLEGVVAVEIKVSAVHDHARASFELQDGVRWRWTDADAASRDEKVRAALARLADLAQQPLASKRRQRL